jgi:hypothetical protein
VRHCSEGGAAVSGRERVAIDDQADALEASCGVVQRFGCGELLGVHRFLLGVVANLLDSLTPR